MDEVSKYQNKGHGKKNGRILAGFSFFSYLCTHKFKGCSRLWAEMIPSKPDSDNADVGMDSSFITRFPFTLFTN